MVGPRVLTVLTGMPRDGAKTGAEEAPTRHGGRGRPSRPAPRLRRRPIRRSRARASTCRFPRRFASGSPRPAARVALGWPPRQAPSARDLGCGERRAAGEAVEAFTRAREWRRRPVRVPRERSEYVVAGRRERDVRAHVRERSSLALQRRCRDREPAATMPVRAGPLQQRGGILDRVSLEIFVACRGNDQRAAALRVADRPRLQFRRLEPAEAEVDDLCAVANRVDDPSGARRWWYRFSVEGSGSLDLSAPFEPGAPLAWAPRGRLAPPPLASLSSLLLT